MSSPKYYGGHLSIAGGFHKALESAKLLEINAIQIHPSAPQRWNSSPYKPGVEDEFLRNLPSSGVKKIFFHGIYLINLANPDPKAQKLSQLSLINDLDLCSRLRADGVIFHVGSSKHEPDELKALALAADAVNAILDESKNSSRLILEVSAGGGLTIGQRFEQLVEIFERVEKKDRIAVGLDTQHLWASGYQLPEDLDNLLKLIDSTVGSERLAAVHLNDSKTACGSRLDRHENLGDGLIGKDRLLAVLNHPKLKEIPFILETPAMKSIETAVDEIKKLRSWLV